MGAPPVLQGFQPMGVCSDEDGSVSIQYEEFEALKLADYENLSQAVAAQKMGISRPTFTRIYNVVRKKIAHAFVEGKPICFEGGVVSFNQSWYRCKECHHVFSLTKNKNRICSKCGSKNLESINALIQKENYRRAGSSIRGMGQNKGICVCMNCGTKIEHVPGNPCNKTLCPVCSHRMRRFI